MGWEDKPRSGYEPGCPSASLRVRDGRMDQDLGMNQDGWDERINQDYWRIAYQPIFIKVGIYLSDTPAICLSNKIAAI